MEDAGVPLRSTRWEGSVGAGTSPSTPQLQGGNLEGLDVSFCLILMLEIPTFLLSGFAGSLAERPGCCSSAGGLSEAPGSCFTESDSLRA